VTICGYRDRSTPKRDHSEDLIPHEVCELLDQGAIAYSPIHAIAARPTRWYAGCHLRDLANLMPRNRDVPGAIRSKVAGIRRPSLFPMVPAVSP